MLPSPSRFSSAQVRLGSETSGCQGVLRFSTTAGHEKYMTFGVKNGLEDVKFKKVPYFANGLVKNMMFNNDFCGSVCKFVCFGCTKKSPFPQEIKSTATKIASPLRELGHLASSNICFTEVY